jgi:hypothetical protein
MPQRPIVPLHGCSDRSKNLRPWRALLSERRYSTAEIHLGRHVPLGNEITSKDLAACVC